MAAKEIHVELLLGKRVLALNGQSIGHLEEIKADLRDGECFVEEFHVGSYAVFERLAAWTIIRVALKIFGARKKHKGYRVPWDKLDLSDPARPRLLCSVEELETVA
jgi:sporulation protein YlmC with PRC-barrel domain